MIKKIIAVLISVVFFASVYAGICPATKSKYKFASATSAAGRDVQCNYGGVWLESKTDLILKGKTYTQTKPVNNWKFQPGNNIWLCISKNPSDCPWH